MPRRSWFAWPCLLVATACGSSPPSTFYALSTNDGVAQPAPVRAIKLRRPGIPGYLDRPEIVAKIVDHRLGLVDTERWGAPLDEMLGHVLAEDLQQRLPGSSVFTEDGAITVDADRVVEVDIRRFDMGDARTLTLVAQIAVEKSDAHSAAARAVDLSTVPKGATTASLVDAMSELLGRLADQIVALVRTG